MGHIIIENKAIECNDHKEILQKFLERWHPKLDEIKKTPLDKKQCELLAKNFLGEAAYYLNPTALLDRLGVLHQLYHEVQHALNLSYARYRSENKQFWDIFWASSLQFPPLYITPPRI